MDGWRPEIAVFPGILHGSVAIVRRMLSAVAYEEIGQEKLIVVASASIASDISQRDNVIEALRTRTAADPAETS